MSEHEFLRVALLLSAGCLLLVAFTRGGSNRARLRRAMGGSAVLGALALLLMSW